MRKIFITCLLIPIILGCAFASACIFGGQKLKYTASGTVYCDSIPLNDVNIKSSTNLLYTTNADGNFSVNVQKDVVIYPEKVGYIFTPSQITITNNNDNIVFIAQKVKDLNGELNLSQIIITPTSISSFGDNFSYNINGNNTLKINKLNVTINNKTINPIDTNYYAIKNKNNSLSIYDDISLKTGIQFTIKFSLDACFTSNNNEYIYTEEKTSILEITQPQTTVDLNSNNQIMYTSVGINSTNNKYTYNITFVFNYYANI